MGRVLITGAAGLLGGEVAGLMRSAGFEVTGLINKNPVIARNDGRIVENVETVRGDITQARFGLGEEAWEALARATDLVVHLAAVTDFTEENDLHRAVNIDGTRNVLAFVERAGAKLVHVSTAYVCGDREGVIREEELLCGQGFTNGYESTKAQAERLVRQSGTRFAIARPAIVLGDHISGRTRSFDTIYPVLKVLAEGWVQKMPADPEATLNLVPIDYVCSGIAEIAERFDEAEGRTFHLVASKPTPLSAFPETLSGFEGLAVPEWTDPEHFDPAALSASEKRFFKRGAEVYARYFTRAPVFDDSGFAAFSGRGCPPTDAAWWRRLVGYAIEAGFIRPRAKARRASA